MSAHILLVEDSQTQAQYIGLILEEAGHQVSVAGTGNRALEMARAFEPDLVMLDVILPDLDGFTVCRRLRQDLTYRVPVLMLTERCTVDDKVDGLEVGADDYLTKPFNERELLARVAALLRTHHLIVELQESIEKGKRSYQVLRRIALTDKLTGLYNRHYFAEMLEREFELARRYDTPLVCIMLDIDFFRNVNTEFGHPVGDKALHEVAQIIQANLRQGDFVARYGGEEFVVLMPQTHAEAAYITAERLRKVIEASEWDTPKGMLRVTISLGIAEMHGTTINSTEELIDCADSALYQSKRAGRNRTEIYKVPIA